MGVATGVVTQSQAQIPSIRPMGVVMGGVMGVVPIPKVKYQGQIPPPQYTQNMEMSSYPNLVPRVLSYPPYGARER